MLLTSTNTWKTSRLSRPALALIMDVPFGPVPFGPLRAVPFGPSSLFRLNPPVNVARIRIKEPDRKKRYI
jgi:hypothetical protein